MQLIKIISRVHRFGLLAVFSLFLISCITVDLAKIKIEKIKPELYRGRSRVRGGSIVPGRKYQLKIKVVSSDAGTIKHINYHDFNIESPDNSLTVVEQGEDFIIVKTDDNSFQLMKLDGYTLSVSVKNNPFPKQTFNWKVNWRGFDRLDYTGKKGRKGKKGPNGRDGYLGGGFMADGLDGGTGEKGARGGHGQEVTLCVLYYKVKGLPVTGIGSDYMFFIYDMTNEKIVLAPIRKITIDASGGDGGDGGDGGLGGNGSKGTGDNEDGKDGDPGNGGNGGIGGDGGTIKLFYTDPAVLTYIKTDVNGGPGGPGGKGKRRGWKGGKGKPGTVIKEKVDLKAMKKMMRGISGRGIEHKRMVFRLNDMK